MGYFRCQKKHSDLFLALLNKPVRHENPMSVIFSSLNVHQGSKKENAHSTVMLDVGFAKRNPLKQAYQKLIHENN